MIAGFRFLSVILWAATATGLSGAPPAPVVTNASTLGLPSKTELWQDGLGKGFQPTVQSFTIEAGPVAGLAAFGSVQAHDLALASLSYGHMLGGVRGQDHWYRGNWELRVELFGGAEQSPSNEWLLGLTPHLRYDFATGSRWIPFLDVGAGVTGTGIGPPDLSNTFEFNLQGGGGTHFFIRENLALTLEVHYLHLSCAGISRPNAGVNGVLGMMGLTWFF